MPPSLTVRQREVLDFIRRYVADNESSPRLEEIADHFGVTAPTAHNYLKTLQSKGYLYFGRTSTHGFFIRLVERAGSAESIIEIGLAGKFDRYGRLFDFPSRIGHFASVLAGAQPENVFALVAIEDLPQASILANDFIIFDQGKKPQPGDICIAAFGEELLLIRVHSRTFDRELHSMVMVQQYQIPEEQFEDERGHMLIWHPLAYDDETRDYFDTFKIEGLELPVKPLPPEFVVATALRLIRALAF